MNRRTLLESLAAAALMAAALPARAEHPAGHEHAGAAPYGALQASAADCVAAGQRCLAHCIRLLADGDESMGACAGAVRQMLTLCSALQDLAAQGSTLTPSMAKLALRGCEDCAAACEPHAGHHAECKACMEACEACIRECKAVS